MKQLYRIRTTLNIMENSLINEQIVEQVNESEWDNMYNYRHLKLYYLCDVFEYKIFYPKIHNFILNQEIEALDDDVWLQYFNENTNHITERIDPRIRLRVGSCWLLNKQINK